MTVCIVWIDIDISSVKVNIQTTAVPWKQRQQAENHFLKRGMSLKQYGGGTVFLFVCYLMIFIVFIV